jgi:hypothetical protein
MRVRRLEEERTGGSSRQGEEAQADAIASRLRHLARTAAGTGPTTTAPRAADYRPRKGRVFFGTEFLLSSYRKANPLAMLAQPPEPSVDATAPDDAPVRRVRVRPAPEAAPTLRAGPGGTLDPTAEPYLKALGAGPVGLFETEKALERATHQAQEKQALEEK